jgi:eukaryotic-like serine/threonine-protein kinase
MKKILEQPSYIRLRNIFAERTTPIVAWIGAGVSAAGGLPTWPALRHALNEQLAQKNQTFEPIERKRRETERNQIQQETNAWVAFERLRAALGPASYQQAVKQALATPPGKMPEVYRRISRLNLGGMVNLNLDRMATRAMTESPKFAKSSPPEFHGGELRNAAAILKSPLPFVVNLHGVLDNASSWILTSSDLRNRQKAPEYELFLNSLLLTRVVLFIGITVQDRAVGSHLERLSRLGTVSGPHFWITSDVTGKTDAWAERHGVELIRYEPSDTTHPEVLEIFEDLLRYNPVEEEPPAASQDLQPGLLGNIPSPEDILAIDKEEARHLLNARASGLLKKPSASAYQEYESFSDEYDEAIHRAWYVKGKISSERFLGYRLEERIASGGFGTVYRARDDAGQLVAIKLLHEDVRRKPEMLQSFRRGVRSMRILSEEKLEGVAKFIQAFEIPASVVMEWVEGPNLAEVVRAGHLDEWHVILSVLADISRILVTGHRLAQRVMHRDVRPPNIMLRNFYGDDTGKEVVLLDFDLSWHRDSEEKSVVQGNAPWGYLAPEQMREGTGASSRNALVDSFGFGMTAYFVLSRKDPYQAQHRHRDWLQTVENAAFAIASKQWRSLPRRIARLIVSATHDEQGRRWDMTQISAELQNLRFSLADPEATVLPDFLAEEMLAVAVGAREYDYSEESRSYVLETPGGLALELQPREPSGCIDLKIAWSSRGTESRRHVGRYIPEKLKEVSEILRKAGFEIEGVNSDTASKALGVQATITVERARKRIAEVASSIAAVRGLLQFQ